MGEDVEGAVFGEFREDYGIYGGKMGCGWVGGEKVCVCVGVGGGRGGGVVATCYGSQHGFPSGVVVMVSDWGDEV